VASRDDCEISARQLTRFHLDLGPSVLFSALENHVLIQVEDAFPANWFAAAGMYVFFEY
jgi:hypothetical protein